MWSAPLRIMTGAQGPVADPADGLRPVVAREHPVLDLPRIDEASLGLGQRGARAADGRCGVHLGQPCGGGVTVDDDVAEVRARLPGTQGPGPNLGGALDLHEVQELEGAAVGCHQREAGVEVDRVPGASGRRARGLHEPARPELPEQELDPGRLTGDLVDVVHHGAVGDPRGVAPCSPIGHDEAVDGKDAKVLAGAAGGPGGWRDVRSQASLGGTPAGVHAPPIGHFLALLPAPSRARMAGGRWSERRDESRNGRLPAAAGTPQLSGTSPWADLRAAMRADVGLYSPAARLRRALRMSRTLAWHEAHAHLAASPALRAHVAAVAPGDRLFWLSHRVYLARGLSARDRVALALSHYDEEGRRFDEAYHDAVYAGAGLTLWRSEAKGAAFELRLMPGNDVLYEGGLSLVLFVDGERVCVLSFSWAPERIVLGRGGESRLPFVTRKQLTGDRAYQAAFHAAFDRVTPAHLGVGALCGLAQALGHVRFAAIAADRHPAATPERRDLLVAAYDDYWTSLGGERVSSLSFAVDLPLRMSPVEDMDAKRRRRALARRAHVEAVRQSAQEIIAQRLKPA